MRYDDPKLDDLVGRVLTGVAVSKDGETTLRLSFADGDPYYVTTGGDCCSESWWADVLGAKASYGSKITAARDLDLPDSYIDGDDRTRQEYDLVYGYALDTSAGTVTLVFRNSSNGYYGGWACQLPEPPEVEWAEITTNEWRA